MTHSRAYEHMRRKLGVRKSMAKPGALLNRMHELKGMPKAKHHKTHHFNPQIQSSNNTYATQGGNMGRYTGSVLQGNRTRGVNVQMRGGLARGRTSIQGGTTAMPSIPGVMQFKRRKHHKAHAPKGPHGRAAVHALGRTKTTGNFAKIEKSKGKAAAIGAYQNVLAKHQGRPAPFHRKEVKHHKSEPNFKHHKEIDFKKHKEVSFKHHKPHRKMGKHKEC